MKSIFLMLLVSLVGYGIQAQSQAETYIKEAQTYLAQKDYKQAQLSLQDAINDLNNLVAGQIADALPNEINGLRSTGNQDVNTSALGMMGGGFQISKRYQHDTKKENDADVQILANSPMLSTVMMYMNNPAMLGQGYKSIRIGTRRAVLKSEMQDYYGDGGGSKQIRSSEIQIPLTQTLITANLRGFASEADELAFVGKLDIENLRVLLGE
jgi:hypothetical protein